jgi:hypothetical protein
MAYGIAAPAAPAAAAPAAPAPSAPAATSAPSTPVTSAPAASAPVAEPSAPAAGGPPAAPSASGEATPAPAAAAGTAAGAEPKQDDFPGDVVSFLEAHNKWEWEKEGQIDEQPAVTAAEAQPADQEKPAAEVDKPAEGEQQPVAAEPAEAVTPEALNALAAKSPELQAAFDANPEVKNALFAMARTNAKAAPILEVFPNVESAKFAADQANVAVNLRAGFLEAVDTPESFPAAFEQFAEQFAITDKDGKPVLDAQGNPTFGDDFHMLNDYVVNTYHDVEIGDLEAAQQAGRFANGDGSADDMALQALKYIKDWRAGKTDGEKPDLSGMDPEAKAYYERKEQELAEREAALGGKEKTQTVEQRQQARTNYEQSVARQVGAAVGSTLKAMLDEKAKVGAFIPSYVMEAKDPVTGISVFAKTIMDQFEEMTYGRVDRATGKVIGGVAFIRDQARMLARRPPSPEAELARVDTAQRLIDEHLPAIFEKEFRKVQARERSDRERTQGRSDIREQLAEREPRAGGSAGTPKPLTPQDAMQQAYQWVDQQFPDIDPSSRTEKALIKKNEIMGGR